MLVKLRMPYRVHSRMVTKLHRSQSDLHERLIQLADRQAQLLEAEQSKRNVTSTSSKEIKSSTIKNRTKTVKDEQVADVDNNGNESDSEKEEEDATDSDNTDLDRKQREEVKLANPSHKIHTGPKCSDQLLANLNARSFNGIETNNSNSAIVDRKVNVRKVRFFLPSKCDVKDVPQKERRQPNPRCESLLKNKKIIISTIEKQPYLDNITKNHNLKEEHKADPGKHPYLDSITKYQSRYEKSKDKLGKQAYPDSKGKSQSHADDLKDDDENGKKPVKTHTEIYKASNLVCGPLPVHEVSPEGTSAQGQRKKMAIRPGSWPVTRIPKAKPRDLANKHKNEESHGQRQQSTRPEVQSALSERSHVGLDDSEPHSSPRSVIYEMVTCLSIRKECVAVSIYICP